MSEVQSAWAGSQLTKETKKALAARVQAVNQKAKEHVASQEPGTGSIKATPDNMGAHRTSTTL
eukprot:3927227-Amphidinium_carterae.1